MTTRTMPATGGVFAPREHAVMEAIRLLRVALPQRLARASARRRLARSIAHLDDRLLADAGLTPQQRGLGDQLLRHFAATSRVFSANAVQR
jgi:hypothetical protein